MSAVLAKANADAESATARAWAVLEQVPDPEVPVVSVCDLGIVRDVAVRQRVLVEVLDWAAAHGWGVAGLVRSSLVGADGNVEYLVWLRRGGVSVDVAALIDAAL